MFSWTSWLTLIGVPSQIAFVKVKTGRVVAAIFGCVSGAEHPENSSKIVVIRKEDNQRFIVHHLYVVLYIE